MTPQQAIQSDPSPLLELCLCGRAGGRDFNPVSDITVRRCDCGIERQLLFSSIAEYELQYLGAYHSASNRHPGCVPYRDRYDSDRKAAAIRFDRYRLTFGRGLPVWPITALDVGCATGAFVDHLRDVGVSAVGVEPDPSMARDHVVTGGLEAAPDELYDLITYHDVLEHLVDPASEIQSASERLARHGALVVDVPDVSTPAGRHHYKAEHLWYFSAQSLVDLFVAAGLRSIALYQPIPGKWTVGGHR